MINYKHHSEFDRVLNIVQQTTGRIGVWVTGDGSAYIEPADAPAVALAILKAAGYGGKGDYVLVNAINTAVACIENHIENTERNAKAEALTKRRDELARELAGDGAYAYLFATAFNQRAIDRIIELESAS